MPKTVYMYVLVSGVDVMNMCCVWVHNAKLFTVFACLSSL